MASVLQLLRPVANLTSSDTQKRASALTLTPFTPELLDPQEVITEISRNRERYENVDLTGAAFWYLYYVAHNKSEAYDYLSIFFEYKQFMVKTLLETALYLCGDTEMRIINRIFVTVSESMTALEAVLCTKLMISAPKWSYFTVNVLYEHVKYPPVTSLTDAVTSTGVKKEYMKLEYCDPIYWQFPQFLRRLKSKKVNKHLYFVTDLPKVEPNDERWARQVQEYAERHA